MCYTLSGFLVVFISCVQKAPHVSGKARQIYSRELRLKIVLLQKLNSPQQEDIVRLKAWNKSDSTVNQPQQQKITTHEVKKSIPSIRVNESSLVFEYSNFLNVHRRKKFVLRNFVYIYYKNHCTSLYYSYPFNNSSWLILYIQSHAKISKSKNA